MKTKEQCFDPLERTMQSFEPRYLPPFVTSFETEVDQGWCNWDTRPWGARLLAGASLVMAVREFNKGRYLQGGGWLMAGGVFSYRSLLESAALARETDGRATPSQRISTVTFDPTSPDGLSENPNQIGWQEVAVATAELGYDYAREAVSAVGRSLTKLGSEINCWLDFTDGSYDQGDYRVYQKDPLLD